MQSAAPTFQRFMGKVVAGLSGVFAQLDGTLIASLTWEEYVAPLSFIPAPERCSFDSQFSEE